MVDENIKIIETDIDNIIKQIEHDINYDIVSVSTIELYNSLTPKQKDLYKLNIDKKAKKKYSDNILYVKKALVAYYNQSIYYMESKLDAIKRKISSIPNNDIKIKYDKLLKDVKIPEYYNKLVANAQDKILLDFNSLFETDNKIYDLERDLYIFKADTSDIELEYIISKEIPDIEHKVNMYVNKEQGITKNSVIIDIDILKSKLMKISLKYRNELVNNKCTELSKYLDTLQNKMVTVKDNNEYYALKEKILLFVGELEKYGKDNIPEEELLILKNKYQDLSKEIDDTYKDKNKQLYNNLTRYLNRSKVYLEKNKEEEKNPNRIEIVETNSEEADDFWDFISVDDIEYHIESVEEADDFYKNYNKAILISSCLASMALANSRVGPIIIPSIMYTNTLVATEYPIIDKINEILAKSINATKESGIYKKINGIKIDSNDMINNLLKSISLLQDKTKKSVESLLNRVKKLAIVTKTKDRIFNIKNNVITRKDKYKDYKTLKLYYEYLLSNKTLEEFCSTRSLSDEEFFNLVNYMKYKDSLDNEEVKRSGR